MLTELQWLALCDRIKTLAQLRYCVYDLYVEGEFLFIEVKSCDNEQQKLLYILDAEGNLI